MQILYLNTDLDLAAACDTTALTDALNSRKLYTLTPSEQGDDGQWYSRFEINVDLEVDEPDATIGVMLDAIEALDGESQQLWAECSTKEFNIGYDCGDEPWAFNQGLTNSTLRRIADLGASLRITLYPHRPDEPSAAIVLDDDDSED